MTRVTFVSGLKSLSTRIACVLTASMERSSGVFLSSASPVQLTNTVGMHRVTTPLGFFSRNAGLVASQIV